jgi:hypothetical protein
MKIKEAKLLQNIRLQEICKEKGIEYDSINTLLESVKTKKLLKRNNYHQQKINDLIENSTK